MTGTWSGRRFHTMNFWCDLLIRRGRSGSVERWNPWKYRNLSALATDEKTFERNTESIVLLKRKEEESSLFGKRVWRISKNSLKKLSNSGAPPYDDGMVGQAVMQIQFSDLKPYHTAWEIFPDPKRRLYCKAVKFASMSAFSSELEASKFENFHRNYIVCLVIDPVEKIWNLAKTYAICVQMFFIRFNNWMKRVFWCCEGCYIRESFYRKALAFFDDCPISENLLHTALRAYIEALFDFRPRSMPLFDINCKIFYSESCY